MPELKEQKKSELLKYLTEKEGYTEGQMILQGYDSNNHYSVLCYREREGEYGYLIWWHTTAPGKISSTTIIRKDLHDSV